MIYVCVFQVYSHHTIFPSWKYMLGQLQSYSAIPHVPKTFPKQWIYMDLNGFIWIYNIIILTITIP